jgi:hypothetical protein
MDRVETEEVVLVLEMRKRMRIVADYPSLPSGQLNRLSKFIILVP